MSKEQNQNKADRSESKSSGGRQFSGKRYSREGGERPRFNREGGDRPSYNREGGERPRFNREGGERQRYNREGGDQPRYSREGGERPRFNREGGERQRFSREGGDRPRYSREDGDRPRFNREGGERQRFSREGGDRPRYNREDGDRPRYSREGGDRPRYSREGGDRPRYNREGGDRPRYSREGGDRPRYSREGGDPGYQAATEQRHSSEPRPIPVFRERRFLAANTEAVPTEPSELRDDRLEGRNPVSEALSAGRKIDKLWVLRPANGKFDPILAKLIYEAKQQGAVIVEVEKPALDKLSQTHAHQGIIAQTAAHDYVEVEDILAYAASRGEAPLILLLDEIQDAYNLGSIFRIADTAGVHGIIIPMRRSVGLDAVVAKASAGAIEHVRCARVNNLSQTIELLKEKGLWIAGTDTEGINIYSDTEVGTKLDGPLALVVGSEGHGMRPLVAKNCDFTLSLPMKGKVNSLNAAVATGIILYEAVRRRGGWLALPQAEATESEQATEPEQVAVPGPIQAEGPEQETTLPAAVVVADDGAGD